MLNSRHTRLPRSPGGVDIDRTLPRDASTRTPPKARETLYLRCVYSQGLPTGDGLYNTLHTFDRMGQELLIGRFPDDGKSQMLALPHDSWASRNHATFVRLAGPDGMPALVVKDRASRNGTCVDGRKVHAATALRLGQVVRVGASLFVVGQAPLERRQAILDTHPPPANYQARSWSALALWDRAMQLAATAEGVLLLGELGTGKTRLARLIHERSPRKAMPFVPFNCSAIPLNLEEATFFGVTAGFIPGVKEQPGIIAQAGQGTLFLDELGELPTIAQAKLLDAFDPSEPSYLRVGGTKRLTTRCRLVFASNQDIFALVEQGTLRHDLVSRLVVAELTIPPLRERREDIVGLFAAALSRHVSGRTPDEVIGEVEVAETLVLAPWTENVRGLETLARRVGSGEALTERLIRQHAGRGQLSEDAPTGIMAGPDEDTVPPEQAGRGGAAFLWPPTAGELLKTLHDNGWSITKAAAHYGRARETLGRYIKQTFGFGGKTIVKQAFRVYEKSGRAPVGPQVALAYKLFFELLGAEYDAVRERWIKIGKL
ncbi:MAG: DNA-binding NtrC family response regulator [Myxococcota bacterium]|jgi:DNA-binding NtrC family response regulator